MIIRRHRVSPKIAGFSLIEVMIAVVVLATGLLALAALQGSLTRSSAEAKVRGRVAAMLSARMDELRGTGYENSALDPRVRTAVTCLSANPTWLCNAQSEANLGAVAGALTVYETVRTFSSAADAANFTQLALGAVPLETDAQFKRVVLEAEWQDSGGGNSHRLAMTSELSALALRSSMLPTDDPSSSANKAPIVRTDDPAVDGVVAIKLGDGNSSAASNPTPELVGAKNNQTIVGTHSDLLTYKPAGVNSIIQKRIERDFIKCNCKYGAGGPDFANLPVVSRTAQWPAIWTGERYEVYKPTPVSDAPGEAFESGPASGFVQHELCTECCRDHHDSATLGVAKFDPQRVVELGQAHEHYSASSSGVLSTSPVPNTNTSNYVEACRIIRVDGMRRVAADMYLRKFNLLETTPVADVQAKTGVPTVAAALGYESFTKAYLKQYNGTVATAPTNATFLFDAVSPSLNDPTLITISAPSTTDFRFLHAHALYVDYLEEKARAKLVSLLASTEPQGSCPAGTDVADCVLPYLPFSADNVTELANWRATAPAVLDVNSRNILNLEGADAGQPSGGASRGVSNGDSDNIAEIGLSNAGFAATAAANTGVDPDDGTLVPDTQAFHVGGTTGTGDGFYVKAAGLSGQNIFISFVIGGDSGICTKDATGDYRCATNSILPATGSITFKNYSQPTPFVTRSITGVCEGATVTDTIPVPAFDNWRVVDPVQICLIDGTNCSTAASPGTPLPDDTGKAAESTTVTLTIPKSSFPRVLTESLVKVSFLYQSTRSDATILSCATNGGQNQIQEPIVWNTFPWN